MKVTITDDNDDILESLQFQISPSSLDTTIGRVAGEIREITELYLWQQLEIEIEEEEI